MTRLTIGKLVKFPINHLNKILLLNIGIRYIYSKYFKADQNSIVLIGQKTKTIQTGNCPNVIW